MSETLSRSATRWATPSFLWTAHHWMMNFPVFASDPRKDTVKPSPYPPEWNSYLLRLVEKGESPENQACLAYKASLLRRRNLSLIARVSQQTPLTHLSLYIKRKKALSPFHNNKVSIQLSIQSYCFNNQLSSGSQVKTSTYTGEIQKNSCL